ncbi:MAG: Gfo/Idh/MocA family oxidoreductase [Phycisphaerales bacterium]|nr:Gfo/Idh/MocA family oxidoreductase [Phycisphaerales bacterium]
MTTPDPGSVTPDRPHHVLLVGCGAMAREWLAITNQLNTVELIGLVDINPTAAAELRQDLPDPLPTFTSLDEALTRTSPTIVFDITPPEAHEDITLTALEAGCHVLGEKPMSTSVESAQRMVAAAREAGRVHAVTQTRRWNPAACAVTRAVDDTLIGNIEEIHADFFVGPHFGGFREEMAHPLLVDMAIHHFDLARMLGQCDPLRVLAHAHDPGRSWYDGKASATAIFEMNDNITFTWRGSWCAEGCPTSWNAHWRLIGDRGTITWDGEEGITIERVENTNDREFIRSTERIAPPPITLPHREHHGAIRDFLDALATSRNPWCPGHDNIKSLAMVLGAVESSGSGQWIDLDTTP